MKLYRLDRPPGPCIGVDPGVNGGAAAFDGERWRTIEWRRMTHSWIVTDHRGEALRWDSWGSALREWLRRVPPVSSATAVEGIAYYKGKGSGLVTLAEAAGEAVGHLWACSDPDTLRPTPNEWRRDVLGLSPRTSAAACATAAIHAVAGTRDPSRSRMVDLGVGLRLGEHAAEAVCIALWAAGCRLAPVDGVA